ncbi:hypothetical protein [Sphingosinicella sp.]|uniref:hypothetical protein n=1 Tax=Sphingosinicella sp. TaxID=1917971 RepID=UPI0018492F69|nr:hypothetical protein [Sphingosinicella sp.]MBA4757733.1 hypothetical protein [Sphingosinicella sp.]
MTQILILVGGYIALLALLSIAARPARRGLIQVSKNLAKLELTERERHMVNALLSASYSWRSAPIIALSFLTGLLQSPHSLDEESEEFASAIPNLIRSEDFHRLFEYHLISVASVNPLFGLLAYAARLAFRAKTRFHTQSRMTVHQIELIGMKAAV